MIADYIRLYNEGLLSAEEMSAVLERMRDELHH